MKIPPKLVLAPLTVMILWASAFVGIRAGLKGYSPEVLALLRYIVASVCMAFIYFRLPKPRLPPLETREWLLVLFLGLTGIGVYNIALNYGEMTVSAGVASFIISQSPILSILLALFFLNERLSRLGWLGVVISFVGVMLIFLAEHHHSNNLLGVGCVLLATVISGFYSIWQKPLLRKLTPVVFTTYAMWGGTAMMFIYWPQLLMEVPRAPLSATLAAVYNGIFPAALAYALWSYVLSHVPAIRATSYFYLMPLFATLIGWLALGEVPAPLSIIGGVVALIGAYCVSRGVLFPTRPVDELSNQPAVSNIPAERPSRTNTP